ncbi:hypothetical protein BRPE64_CCDS04350 [Caballeronia insecticola]|uniref:Uncharacterized protein n=1 Tax=Caballeronia insecticola TaxID=758793 RepID=R4WPC3_9BURK|nr:hypothetical protein BRPE64_CCDS04350 [Caballeronia insecticola]
MPSRSQWPAMPHGRIDNVDRTNGLPVWFETSARRNPRGNR